MLYRNQTENIKQLQVVIDNKRTIHCGAACYADYKNDGVNDNYISRHGKNENWNDYSNAGVYANHILWNKPTVKEATKIQMKKIKMINVKYK